MKIPILHLVDGIHRYTQIASYESLNFDSQEIYTHPLHIEVELNKFEKNIQCHARIKTVANFVCDRCLKDFSKNVHCRFDLLFRLGDDILKTDEEDVVHIPFETVEIDLANWIREYLILMIPIKKLCSRECPGICSGCGEDLNSSSCRCGEPPMDPRWEKLKALKNKI